MFADLWPTLLALRLPFNESGPGAKFPLRVFLTLLVFYLLFFFVRSFFFYLVNSENLMHAVRAFT